MIDFEKARQEALEEIKKTNTVSILSPAQILKLNIKHDAIEVWSIQIEIFLPDETVKTVQLLCALPEDFPLHVPKFYLTEADYEWIRYIPHVDTYRFICLFDEQTITVDPNNPGGIIKACLEKARSILENGLKKINHNDFNEEFLAYWNDNYNKTDKLVSGLSIIDSGFTEQDLKFLIPKKGFQNYYYFLVNEGKESTNFKGYLKECGDEYEEHEFFYLGQLQGLKPPYIYDNEKVFHLVKSSRPEKIDSFRKFINNGQYPKIVLFDTIIKGTSLFFGFVISYLKIERNGFRSSNLTPFDVFTSFEKHTSVSRLTFEEFTTKRLECRTDGPLVLIKRHSITFAGLGSIGSNLLHFLFTSELEKLVLIDPEILTVANINRHLLGMSYVNFSKADALRHFFQNKIPLVSIDSYETSVIPLIKERINLFNDADFNFIAIGKDNVEGYVIDCLNSSIIIKPTFILWVEPYLCGAHCLYVTPGHDLNYRSLYTDNLYKYNMIGSEEYTDPKRQLIFREAGCQSSYVPYGKKNIVLFISALMPVLFELMETNRSENIRLTWKGNKKIFDELNLKESKEAELIKFGEIKISIL